jgi:hypothetical protein
LRKFFGGQDLEDHTADFQQLYGELREVSKRLNDPVIQPVVDSLDEIGGRLDELLGTLDVEDRRVDPSLVRLFFRRIKTHDERLLLDLVRFYIEIQRGQPWQSDRIDKVDFIVSRLAGAVAGEDLGRDRTRLSKVLENLSALLAESAESDLTKIENRQRMIQAVRDEIMELESFEELTRRDLVGHYRQIKHGLGEMIFEKSILPIIVDTNLALSEQILALSREEERRILEDYEKVAQLEQEGGVDRQLADAVNQLHLQVSQFRKQIDSGNIRLHDMARIRRSVLQILERVAEQEPGDDELAPELSDEQGSVRLAVGAAVPSPSERRLIGPKLEEIIEVLEQSEQTGSDDRRVEARALSYRLERRELEAFDRLAGAEACDEELELFILASAALRHRINEEVNAIHSQRRRADEEESQAAPTSAILGLGDLFLRRFGHFLESGAVAGSAPEMQELQLLRMRLMRDYSGLWLVANPTDG